MTPPNDSLLPSSEAFEEWFFARRKEWASAGVKLTETDANSMWDGWQAAWGHPSASQAAMVEELATLKEKIYYIEGSPNVSPCSQSINNIVDKAIAIVTKHTQPPHSEE